MEQIKVSSAIVYLMDFDVVREWVSHFPCYRKDNYIEKYLQLTEPLFPNCQFFLIGVLNMQSTLVISTSVISKNRLPRRKNLVLVITQKSKIRL